MLIHIKCGMESNRKILNEDAPQMYRAHYLSMIKLRDPIDIVGEKIDLIPEDFSE